MTLLGASGSNRWLGVASAVSQIFRLKTRVLRNTSKHLRTYLVGIVEGEDIVKPALPSKGLVGARLTLEMPSDSD
jgi:hypothetical protein